MSAPEFFEHHPVFTYEDFEQYSASHGSANANTLRAILAYHIKKHHIKRIRRGLFASIPSALRHTAESFIVDPYLIGGLVSKDAVIAYHSAFDFYGISYSTYHQFTFMSENKVRPFTFQDINYHCLSFPKILIDNNQTDVEVITSDRHGIDVKVTSLERTLVDALDRPDYAGGWEEIWRSVLHIPILNLDKVANYVMLLNNATLCAKLGFFLEQHKALFNVDNLLLSLLEEKKPKGIHFLERNKRDVGKYIKRWNLVVPAYIIEQAWEEPINDDV
jgi:predicted transcriptional regulator of viral defense system